MISGASAVQRPDPHQRSDDPCDRDHRARQAVRRHPRRGRHRPSRGARRRLRSARPQRRGQDHDHPRAEHASSAPTRERARARPRHRARGRRGARQGEPDRAVRLGRRGPDGHENLVLVSRLFRPHLARRAGPGRRAARARSTSRLRRQAGARLLRGDAAAARHRGQPRRDARAPLPRRADHGARPAQPQARCGRSCARSPPAARRCC
jgi:hypothetical protein